MMEQKDEYVKSLNDNDSGNFLGLGRAHSKDSGAL